VDFIQFLFCFFSNGDSNDFAEQIFIYWMNICSIDSIIEVFFLPELSLSKSSIFHWIIHSEMTHGNFDMEFVFNFALKMTQKSLIIKHLHTNLHKFKQCCVNLCKQFMQML